MKVILITTLFLFQHNLFAQIGGLHTFEYVNLPLNAHAAALGGINVSVSDINMTYQNPALLRTDFSKTVSLSYMPYFADIKNSSAMYVHTLRKDLPLSVGVQYFSSGQMLQTDVIGNDLGTYSVNQYFLYGSASHKISNYTLGGTVKLAGSQIGSYSAYALLGDLGGVFKHPKRDFTIGLAVKNFGLAVKKYNADANMAMPFDIQIGTSYRLEHMPFRFSLTAHHLQQFDIVYQDPTVKGVLDDKGQEIKPKKSFADKLGRHFIIGGEFFLGKSLSLLFGYNYLRRQELQVETKTGVAGFSFGGSIKIKSFNLIYSRAFYQPIGGANYLTVNASLQNLFKKKEAPSSPNVESTTL